MDATMQINAFNMTAGCTLCLDNVPNQLAVLGHFRAMLEMCQNQIEGDEEQLDSLREVETQLRTVKLMIKIAQAKRKACKVEVMPCILSSSLHHQQDIDISASISNASPRPSHSGRARHLPELDAIRQEEEVEKARSKASVSEPAQSKENEKRGSDSSCSTTKEKEKLPNLNGQKDPKEVKQVPTPPTTSSIGRYIPSFLRKVRFISKEVSEGETQPRKVERRNSERPMKSKAIVDDKDLSNVHEVHQSDPLADWREIMQAEVNFQKRQVSC